MHPFPFSCVIINYFDNKQPSMDDNGGDDDAQMQRIQEEKSALTR